MFSAVKPSSRRGSVHSLSAREPGDLARWKDLVASAPLADVYYHPGYVCAYEPVEQTRAFALHFPEIGAGFLSPLLLRTVTHAPSGRAFRDALTPYGYGGVLYLGSKPPAADRVDDFLTAVRAWCAEKGLVGCVLRLHPLSGQTVWFKEVEHRPDVAFFTQSETTAVTLAHPARNSGPLQQMGRGRQSDLHFAQKKLKVSWASTADESWISTFQSLYEPTLLRLRAREFFFFPREYYAQLAGGLAEDFAVAIATHDSEPVGAAIFLRGKNWAHYHLSATSGAGRKMKATTLLVHEGARWAAAAGCRLLHLGGGMSPGDSLVTFKTSFGGDRYQYSSLCIVADREAYELLRHEASVWPYGQVPEHSESAALAGSEEP